MYFEKAVDLFEDSSIDILHIDGLHTYEAVKNDYETWRPKLSHSAVVLFHDTQVRKDNFGVWQYWAELRQNFGGFEFLHSAGLGVLFHGSRVDDSLMALCQVASSPTGAKLLSDRFETYSDIARQRGTSIPLLQLERPGTNIALNCYAEQSSAFSHAPTAQGAVNGCKNGNYGFHTAFEDKPWWKIDLSSIQEFDEIRVYNRIDSICSRRAYDLQIWISDDNTNWELLYSNGGLTFGGIDGNPLIVARPRCKTRYIKLSLRNENFLHLDEVEVIRYD